MDSKTRILESIRKAPKVMIPKHPEIKISIPENFNSVSVIGKVTKRFRQLGYYETIEEFMLQATVAESNEEFLNVVRKFIKVKIDE